MIERSNFVIDGKNVEIQHSEQCKVGNYLGN